MKRRTHFGHSLEQHRKTAAAEKAAVVEHARNFFHGTRDGECDTFVIDDFARLHLLAGNYFANVEGAHGPERTRDARAVRRERVEREIAGVLRLLNAARKRIATNCVRK